MTSSQSLSTPSHFSASGALASQAVRLPSALHVTLPVHVLPSFLTPQVVLAPLLMAQALQVQAPAVGAQ